MTITVKLKISFIPIRLIQNIKMIAIECVHFFAVIKYEIEETESPKALCATANNKRKTSMQPAAKKELSSEEKHYSAQELEMEVRTAEYFQMNCDLCMHRFSSWSDARLHYLDRHNILKPFLRCCNRKFFLRSRIIEHIIWHVDPSAFQ